MKKIIYLIVLFGLISCNRQLNFEKQKINRIEVYHVSFGILFPTQTTESFVRKSEVRIIDDLEKIEEIKERFEILDTLKSSGFNENSVYLACDFFNDSEKVATLLFDKNKMKINGLVYKKDQKLIDLLVDKNSK